MANRKVVVIAGPSGSGETTFTNELVLAYPHFVRAVSATTREPRMEEVEGVDYHFLSKEEFFEGVHDGKIPEHTFVKERDAYYGTYLPDLENKFKEGKTVIVNTDLSGARYFKENHGAKTIFIKPKSIDVLRDRLYRRDPSITDKEVEMRLLQAMEEIVNAEGQYDHVVFNTDGEFADTIIRVVEILKREGYNV